MTELERLDAIETRQKEASEMVENAKNENRHLSETEETRLSEIENELNELRNNEIKEKKEIKMPKFNLIDAINNVIDNRQHDEETQAYLDATKRNASEAGLGYAGQIQIATSKRALDQIVTTNKFSADTYNGGGETIETNVMDLEGAIKDNPVLSRFKLYSGLRGDVTFPLMDSDGIATFEGETTEKGAKAPVFAEVAMKPHRLTVNVPISKTLLRQSSPQIQQQIQNDIIETLTEKFQKEILGYSTTVFPDAMMASATSVSALTYDNVVALESDVEAKNMSPIFIANTKMKGALKTTPRFSNGDTPIWMDGQCDDLETLTTNSVKADSGSTQTPGLVAVDPSQVLIGIWGDTVDVVVDGYTLAAKNQIRLVITMYVDYKLKRSNAVKALKVSAS